MATAGKGFGRMDERAERRKVVRRCDYEVESRAQGLGRLGIEFLHKENER